MQVMDIDVFDAFPERLTSYEFLTISRGTVYGNQITNISTATGIFKLRNEMIQVNNQELKQSAATLHIRPTEAFANNNMVGQGIRVEGQDYEIIGQTGGDNYANGVREHYRLSLQNSDYSNFTVTS